MTKEGRVVQYRAGLAPTPWPRWPPVSARDTRNDRKSNDSNGIFRDKLSSLSNRRPGPKSEMRLPGGACGRERKKVSLPIHFPDGTRAIAVASLSDSVANANPFALAGVFEPAARGFPARHEALASIDEVGGAHGAASFALSEKP